MHATMHFVSALIISYVLLQMQDADAEVPQEKLDAAQVGKKTHTAILSNAFRNKEFRCMSFLQRSICKT